MEVNLLKILKRPSYATLLFTQLAQFVPKPHSLAESSHKKSLSTPESTAHWNNGYTTTFLRQFLKARLTARLPILDTTTKLRFLDVKFRKNLVKSKPSWLELVLSAANSSKHSLLWVWAVHLREKYTVPTTTTSRWAIWIVSSCSARNTSVTLSQRPHAKWHMALTRVWTRRFTRLWSLQQQSLCSTTLFGRI